MRNPFTLLKNKITQKFGERWRVKSQEPLEKEKEKLRSSAGGGSTISSKVSNDEEAKKESAHYYPTRFWKQKKKARKQSRLSRRINALKRQHKKAA